MNGLAQARARAARCRRSRTARDVYVPVEEIEPGMTILVAAGERMPVDALVVDGQSGARLLAGHRRKRAAGVVDRAARCTPARST